MATFPRDKMQFLLWAEAHADLWADAPTTIGLTTIQADAFKDAVESLNVKTTAQQSAKQAQKAATEAATDAHNATMTMASDLVRAIRSYALNTSNPEVYQLAQIPAPQAPSPMPPPGQPTNFTFTINPGGALTLKWKAVHPEGSANVVYFVKRKLQGETGFTLVGGSGDREYLDETIPFGTDRVSYIIYAQRGQTQGQPSIEQTVSFGSLGGDGFVFTQGQNPSASAKLAA